MARFEEQVAEWKQEAWSVVAEFQGPIDETGVGLVDLSFLFPERGPTSLLKVGSRFQLMEGERVVAEGEVVR